MAGKWLKAWLARELLARGLLTLRLCAVPAKLMPKLGTAPPSATILQRRTAASSPAAQSEAAKQQHRDVCYVLTFTKDGLVARWGAASDAQRRDLAWSLAYPVAVYAHRDAAWLAADLNNAVAMWQHLSTRLEPRAARAVAAARASLASCGQDQDRRAVSVLAGLVGVFASGGCFGRETLRGALDAFTNTHGGYSVAGTAVRGRVSDLVESGECFVLSQAAFDPTRDPKRNPTTRGGRMFATVLAPSGSKPAAHKADSASADAVSHDVRVRRSPHLLLPAVQELHSRKADATRRRDQLNMMHVAQWGWCNILTASDRARVQCARRELMRGAPCRSDSAGGGKVEEVKSGDGRRASEQSKAGAAVSAPASARKTEDMTVLVLQVMQAKMPMPVQQLVRDRGGGAAVHAVPFRATGVPSALKTAARAGRSVARREMAP